MTLHQNRGRAQTEWTKPRAPERTMTSNVDLTADVLQDTRCIEFLATISGAADNPEYSPVNDAAFFYGLCLRGHSIEKLRANTDVPAEVLSQWAADDEIEEPFRRYLAQVYEYRKQVLAIFESRIAEEQRCVLQQ
jgi:hypothetical protein